MTPTKQRPTEDELIAYELGYRQCCRDNDIPYLGIRNPFNTRSIIAFHIEITDKEAEYLFPNHTDELAKYITKKLEEVYEKFKRGEPLD